jgi:hypothetical protein
MRKLICAMAAALALGTTGAAANYDYVDEKGYRHWDHTGTDATEKPAASATPKGSKRRPVIHATRKSLVKPRTLPKAATKPLIPHGTPPLARDKSGDESPKAKADRDALFQEFQDFLLAAKPTAVEPPKSEPGPEPKPAGNDGQQKSKTGSADTATDAISAPEAGRSAALPTGKDAPAALQDFAPSSLNSNQQNTVSNVVVSEKEPELFFRHGAKIIELLRATGYSDYAPHEIPPEVVALEPALAMFRFVKRPEGDIGLVSGLTNRTLGVLKYRDASAPLEMR